MSNESPADAHLLSGQALAYVGDSVHDLHVRTRAVQSGAPIGAVHRAVVERVRCAAQSDGLNRIEPLLTPEELAIVKRGRNSHSHHARPRGTTPMDYSRATGLEALLGYLYLTGCEARINALLDALE
ncbi:MAG: ribonuclease III [Oscillospiraceae bacterium]|nr:ribonuclease III [Oscillospiraceae bacterium]